MNQTYGSADVDGKDSDNLRPRKTLVRRHNGIEVAQEFGTSSALKNHFFLAITS